jgi:Tetratricopeptide repeat
MAALSRFRAGLLLAAVIAPLLSGQYVGSKACYGCHTGIYRSFQKTDMGHSMSLASDWTTATLPAQAVVSKFAVSHDPTGWRQTESEPGVFTAEHNLEYTVGSGANGLSFLIRRGAYLFQAPLSFYTKTHKWDLSPGYERSDLGFGRVVPEECVNCHAGRPAPVEDRPGAYANPPFQELAIGCENCHGPGEQHVQSLGKRAGPLVNPAKLPLRLAENICMNCHQTGDARILQPGKRYRDFRPGEWLFDTAVIVKQPAQKEADLLEHWSAMQASRCFRASGGKLGCMTCHDPHVQPRGVEAAAYYREKCLTCHSEQSCKLPLKDRPGNDCANCHMPKRGIQQISHSALTNHRIGAGEVSPLPALDGLVIVNAPAGRTLQLAKPTLLRAYGELAPRNPDFQKLYLNLLEELSRTLPQDTFVQAALGHKALTENKNDEAIEHLKLALPLKEAGVYLELGQAQAKLGHTDEAIEYLGKAAEMDPYNAVAQKTLILEYITAKSYAQARQHLEQYVENFPEDLVMREALARVSK